MIDCKYVERTYVCVCEIIIQLSSIAYNKSVPLCRTTMLLENYSCNG